jgi:CRP-like cAMP-binding protein
MKRMAREYIGAETQLVVRAHLDVSSRIAHLLSAKVSESLGEDGQKRRAVVMMGREEMALLVGTTRETLSRSLKKLALRGIIRLDNGAIQVLDLQALQDLAG